MHGPRTTICKLAYLSSDLCDLGRPAGRQRKAAWRADGNSAEVNAMVYTQVLDHGLRMAVERVSEELFSDCSLLTETVN